MAQATAEPTTPAAEAHPVLTPFRRGLSLLADLRDIRDRQGAHWSTHRGRGSSFDRPI